MSKNYYICGKFSKLIKRKLFISKNIISNFLSLKNVNYKDIEKNIYLAIKYKISKLFDLIIVLFSNKNYFYTTENINKYFSIFYKTKNINSILKFIELIDLSDRSIFFVKYMNYIISTYKNYDIHYYNTIQFLFFNNKHIMKLDNFTQSDLITIVKAHANLYRTHKLNKILNIHFGGKQFFKLHINAAYYNNRLGIKYSYLDKYSTPYEINTTINTHILPLHIYYICQNKKPEYLPNLDSFYLLLDSKMMNGNPVDIYNFILFSRVYFYNFLTLNENKINQINNNLLVSYGIPIFSDNFDRHNIALFIFLLNIILGNYDNEYNMYYANSYCSEIIDCLDNININKNLILFKRLFDRINIIINNYINKSLVFHINYLVTCINTPPKFILLKNKLVEIIYNSNMLNTIEYNNILNGNIQKY